MSSRAVNSVCVFCGSSPGVRPAYAEAAADMGRLLAEEGIGLVYGGASIGLMGVLAAAALDAGGEVSGVIPQALVDREIGNTRVDELRVVGSMHERKALMAELADAFVALPGGLGTLEELAEVYTWAQLGLHSKPLGILDVEGYFEGLVGFLDHAVGEGFVSEENRSRLVVERESRALLDRLRSRAPTPPA